MIVGYIKTIIRYASVACLTLIINAPSQDHSFIVLATVKANINYHRTVIMIVNYVCKTFIVQATERSHTSINECSFISAIFLDDCLQEVEKNIF
jgi:hypothetical protein